MRAALVLGLLLAAGSVAERIRPRPAPARCHDPRELSAEAGHTTAVACSRGVGAPIRGPAVLLFGERLDLATADAQSLEVLPGIGPSRAAAIVAERSERPFESVDDLVRVPGIGRQTVEGLRAWLRVGPSPRLSPGPRGG